MGDRAGAAGTAGTSETAGAAGTAGTSETAGAAGTAGTSETVDAAGTTGASETAGTAETVDTTAETAGASDTEEAVVVRSVSRSYGTVNALSKVSFSLPKGQVVGLLGPNGAGKTTLLRVLCGYLLPDDGTVHICGHDLLTEPVGARRKIGYMPERAPAIGEFTCKEYLRFIARVRGVSRDMLDGVVEHALSRTGLGGFNNRLVRNLSRGYRQRLALSAAIVHEPPVIVLDEPAAGLDPNQIYDLRELIVSLGRRHTVIVSSHIMQEIEAVAGRVVVLDRGEVIADGTPEKLLGSREIAWDAVLESVPRESERLRHILEQYPGQIVVLDDHSGDEHSIRARFTPNREATQTSVFDWAVAHGVKIRELHESREGLESVFRRLTTTESEEKRS